MAGHKARVLRRARCVAAGYGGRRRGAFEAVPDELLTSSRLGNRNATTPSLPEDHQRRQLAQAGVNCRSGQALSCVILADDRVVGRININDIVRGAFDSAHLGYWVAEERNGRGVATAAVTAAARLCFEDLGLHRIQAATLTHNIASQRVLDHNGFTYIGTAPQYLLASPAVGRTITSTSFSMNGGVSSGSCCAP